MRNKIYIIMFSIICIFIIKHELNLKYYVYPLITGNDKQMKPTLIPNYFNTSALIVSPDKSSYLLVIHKNKKIDTASLESVYESGTWWNKKADYFFDLTKLIHKNSEDEKSHLIKTIKSNGTIIYERQLNKEGL